MRFVNETHFLSQDWKYHFCDINKTARCQQCTLAWSRWLQQMIANLHQKTDKYLAWSFARKWNTTSPPYELQQCYGSRIKQLGPTVCYNINAGSYRCDCTTGRIIMGTGWDWTLNFSAGDNSWLSCWFNQLSAIMTAKHSITLAHMLLLYSVLQHILW